MAPTPDPLEQANGVSPTAHASHEHNTRPGQHTAVRASIRYTAAIAAFAASMPF